MILVVGGAGYIDSHFVKESYGRSKLMVERMLEDFSQSYGLNYVVLRYFNDTGAE